MKQSVIGTKTMVVSPHYLASMAGSRILQQGGNAFDAAVAISACLAVVYPHMTGIGGDSFWLCYSSKDRNVRAYNASGRAGSKVTIDTYAGESVIPFRGVRSAITVPGMVDGWDAVLREYGRLTLAEVLEPAISYAADGFPMTKDQHAHTLNNFALLSGTPYTSGIYTPGQRVPEPGERFVQSDLASSLRDIAAHGRESFYTGKLAQAITGFLEQSGGLLTADDFAAHRGNWVTPVSTTYRGYTVYQMPPNSQGFVGLMALNILEQVDLKSFENGSYEYYHLLVEALKRSFQDRNEVLSDPDFCRIPLDKLLDKDYAREMFGEISMESALAPAVSKPMGSDTAYAAVVDEEGNAVSFIQSLYFEYGSGVVAGNTGILLQNRGSFFSLDPEHVNCLQPNKRSFHTLMPALACKDGKPAILYGTQGGEGQPQTQTAIITRMIDYGMHPQEAVNEPRFVWGRTWGNDSQELKLEGRVDQRVAKRLAAAGHDVKIVNDFDGIMGHAHAIRIDDSGFLYGGFDPRSDGLSIGW
ncbi:gamma-glutamyltransferase [Paenibacillus sp. H1-7]|uniref:gamma-glutamyltransferase n=1 Tax=Paenibacillus sp. H1-7 TaxID=2282849 RepID=UPI001EF82CA3|nr:gamma-glutamyltransferase [Paenibacillus sp. H1-7]ULL13642.1 gamma-glutamyltransferase [Paenibacillus sp. H1-7]